MSLSYTLRSSQMDLLCCLPAPIYAFATWSWNAHLLENPRFLQGSAQALLSINLCWYTQLSDQYAFVNIKHLPSLCFPHKNFFHTDFYVYMLYPCTGGQGLSPSVQCLVKKQACWAEWLLLRLAWFSPVTPLWSLLSLSSPPTSNNIRFHSQLLCEKNFI